jgi:hypothetical protein
MGAVDVPTYFNVGHELRPHGDMRSCDADPSRNWSRRSYNPFPAKPNCTNPAATSWLELGKPQPTPYHKIGHDPQAIEALLVDLFLDAHARPPRQVILDLDATGDAAWPSGRPLLRRLPRLLISRRRRAASAAASCR